MKRRSFTKEFKLEILKQIEVRPLVEVCREYELLPAIITRWKREFEGNPHEAFAGKGNLWKEDARTAHYERLIGQLYAEISFLKKNLQKIQQLRQEERKR